VADVLDAGTTMRFLTAYFSVTNQSKFMTGTARMCERPIGILVEALKKIGADISYQNIEGYPPLKINGFKTQITDQVEIRGDVSSQYISALLMVAPVLPLGLKIKLTGTLGSIPYIKMTIEQMRAFGIEVLEDWENKNLKISPQSYKPITYKIESDWSGASYWYSVVALSPNPDTKIELWGLKENSLQGDSVIAEIMTYLGVKSTFTNNGILLEKCTESESLTWDFTNCPDLAQTVAVVAVLKGLNTHFTGIESLKIKETDRVLALQNELKKLGGELVEVEENHKYLIQKIGEPLDKATINTYDDHRMAMAFAPAVIIKDVIIAEPEVVAKSYPEFWKDFNNVAEIIKL
jgi:3-phosphoshikimate 1-carboxyvinyltransferase